MLQKTLTVLGLIAITLILSSCNINDGQVGMTIDPGDTNSEPPVAEKAFVNVGYATDEILGNYDSVDEFVDYENECAQKIIFTTNTVIEDFRYIELEHNLDDTGLVYFEGTTLYLGELLPEKPFVVTWTEFGDLVSYRGIAFADENNRTKYFNITISGKDGSLLLIEFRPPQTMPESTRQTTSLSLADAFLIEDYGCYGEAVITQVPDMHKWEDGE